MRVGLMCMVWVGVCTRPQSWGANPTGDQPPFPPSGYDACSKEMDGHPWPEAAGWSCWPSHHPLGCFAALHTFQNSRSLSLLQGGGGGFIPCMLVLSGTKWMVCRSASISSCRHQCRSMLPTICDREIPITLHQMISITPFS